MLKFQPSYRIVNKTNFDFGLRFKKIDNNIRSSKDISPKKPQPKS